MKEILFSLVLGFLSTTAFASKASFLMSLDEGGANLGGDFQLSDGSETSAVFLRIYPEDKDDGKLGRLAAGGFLRMIARGGSLSLAASFGGSIMSVSLPDGDDEILIGPAMSFAVQKRVASFYFGLDYLLAHSWFGENKGISPIISDIMFSFGLDI